MTGDTPLVMASGVTLVGAPAAVQAGAPLISLPLFKLGEAVITVGDTGWLVALIVGVLKIIEGVLRLLSPPSRR